MKFLKCSFWASIAAVVLMGGASAQTIGGLGGTTGGTTGGTVGSGAAGGIGGGGIGGGGGGGGIGGGGVGGGGGSSTNSTGTNSGVSSVTITAPSTYAQNPQGVATSNVVGKYFANPFYQGRAGVTTSTATSVVNPGGFGTALYGASGGAPTTTGATGGRGGAAGGIGGGGFGGTTAGNARGMGTTGMTGQTGQAQVAVQGVTGIAYTASVKFATTTPSPAQFQADLQALLNRTSTLSNAGGIQLTTGPNGAVTLRGQVRDADEARLIEGLMRTTPGVRTVSNELQFPPQ